MLKEYVEKLSSVFIENGSYVSLSEFLRDSIREKAERDEPQFFMYKNLELTHIKDLKAEVKTN